MRAQISSPFAGMLRKVFSFCDSATLFNRRSSKLQSQFTPKVTPWVHFATVKFKVITRLPFTAVLSTNLHRLHSKLKKMCSVVIRSANDFSHFDLTKWPRIVLDSFVHHDVTTGSFSNKYTLLCDFKVPSFGTYCGLHRGPVNHGISANLLFTESESFRKLHVTYSLTCFRVSWHVGLRFRRYFW